MRMHAYPIGFSLGLVANVVTAVPNKRARQPLARHDGAEILPCCSADLDDAAHKMQFCGPPKRFPRLRKLQ
jgi:hypothetical protein